MKQDQKRAADLMLMAKGLYATIIGLTEDPQEACTIIEMLHLMLWMNCSNGESTVDVMLTEYCKSFKHNLEANEAIERGRMQ